MRSTAGRLTHGEQLGICHLLLLGGLDTVTATLDCMITYLASHPDRRQAVVDNPELMNPAIEEMLRQQTPVMMIPRMIAQDCELGGVQMTAGDSATLMIGAANVDEAEFDSSGDVLARPGVEPAPRVRRRSAPLPRLAPRAAWSCGSRSRSSTSGSPSTRSPTASRSTSRPASARPRICRSFSRCEA